MTTLSIELDTDRDGTFDAAIDNITQYVVDLKTSSGFSSELAHTADIGQLFLTVNNADRRFSTDYAAGPLYNELLPYLPIRVRATVGATTYTLFRGYVKDIEPEAGSLGGGRCLIVAEDALSMFQRETIEIPPFVDMNSGTLAKIVTADVFSGAAATGTATFNDLVEENETITIKNERS